MTNQFSKVHSLRSFNHRNPHLAGSPSVFYGDPIEVGSEQVAPAIINPNEAANVVPAAVVATGDDVSAAKKLAAYDQMGINDRTTVTKLPPLATWNAAVIVNPNLGKISAANLNYFLTKSLVEYPFEGRVVYGSTPQSGISQVVLDKSVISKTGFPGFKSLPFFRFTISASNMNARPGGNYTVQLEGKDETGAVISTNEYSFQRISATEAIFGVFIPFQVVSTRTLPALPIFGALSAEDAVTCTITFSGLSNEDVVTLTVPGYSTNEMREISQMYNLTAGMIK